LNVIYQTQKSPIYGPEIQAKLKKGLDQVRCTIGRVSDIFSRLQWHGNIWYSQNAAVKKTAVFWMDAAGKDDFVQVTRKTSSANTCLSKNVRIKKKSTICLFFSLSL